MVIKNILKLIISILICETAGAIGSLFTFSSIPTWYANLKKPFFTPPNWLFGPAWTFLYFLMGISFYLIWEKSKENSQNKKAIFLFFLQLILNSLWSIIFFGLKSPFFAFLEIIILWFAILFTIIKFKLISKKAAYILIPYLCWVTFASILNFSVLILNR